MSTRSLRVSVVAWSLCLLAASSSAQAPAPAPAAQRLPGVAPKVVVILAGTNDIAGNTEPISNAEIEGNLASLAELARAHDIRVVFSSVMPLHIGSGRTTAGPIVSEEGL